MELPRLLARVLARLLVALVPAAGLLVLASEPAAACSCATERLRDHVAAADTVLVGTLVDVDEHRGSRWYDFEVAQVLRGEAGPRAEVRSAASGASCGLERMRTGTSYVVFATGGSASLCGGTTTADASYVERVTAVTGPPRPPAAEGPAALEPGRDRGSGPLVLAALAGAGGALVAAALLSRRLRRR